MQIACLVNTYPLPSQTFIRREIAALERRGHRVHRFALRGPREALVDAEDMAEHARTERILDAGAARLVAGLAAALARAPRRGLAALRLALACGRRSETGVLRHLIYLAEAARVAARCRALGIGHLHAHFGTNSATVAMLSGVLGGPRWSFTVHGPEEFDAPRALSLPDKVARAAATVAISAHGRSQILRWAAPGDWGRVQIVPCGIEPGRFADPAPLPPPAPFRLVSVGRLAEQKGQAVLIEALAEAAPRLPGLSLDLVGEGPLRPWLEARAREHGLGPALRFLGLQDGAGVRAAIEAAHVLVLPSFAEGLPVVIMEAMALERPVIATWVAGVPELVLPGETGWLVPPGDPRALAAAILAAAATPPERLQAMGAAGRARVLARHDIDAAAARLAALFGAEAAAAGAAEAGAAQAGGEGGG